MFWAIEPSLRPGRPVKNGANCLFGGRIGKRFATARHIVRIKMCDLAGVAIQSDLGIELDLELHAVDNTLVDIFVVCRKAVAGNLKSRLGNGSAGPLNTL